MDTQSFMIGFVCGLIIDWTDILPMLGGVCLGYSLHYVSDTHIEYVKQYLNSFRKKTIKRKSSD